MGNARILLVDDHKIVRQALKSLIEGSGCNFSVEEAKEGQEAIKKVGQESFDLIISDVNMPGMHGAELTAKLLKIDPTLKVLALSMMDDNTNIREMLSAGARGYILKDCDEHELLFAIKTVLEGEQYFSPKVQKVVMQSLTQKKQAGDEPALSKREKEILYLLFKENSNKEIANQLYISLRTVETHKRNIMEKTGAKNLAGLVKYAIRHSLFTELFQ